MSRWTMAPEDREAFLASFTDPASRVLAQQTLDRDDRVAANAPTGPLPACPWWCRHHEVVGADHGYDSVGVDEVTFSRFHASGSDEDFATVNVEEFNCRGQVSYGPVCLFTDDRDEHAEQVLLAEQARQRAASLLNAADLLDTIEATHVTRG